ncbi:MAG: hypothetical protein ACLP01_31570 [Solirubrobacteraceae bacterium]
MADGEPLATVVIPALSSASQIEQTLPALEHRSIRHRRRCC